MQFDVATLLAQWAAGGLAFCWVTTRRREVGVGYGWLLRISYGALAALSLVAGFGDGGAGATLRNVGTGLMVAGAAIALAVSYARREEGLDGFDPRLDLIAPVFGLLGLFGAASFVGGDYALSLARLLVGGLFLGAVSDAMLLGHWYLVQPGLARAPLLELVRWTGWLCIPEIVLLLVPTGMVSVLDGRINDNYNGLLGWFWVACAVTTVGLVVVTRLALKERYYSAVMSATGLLYLAILTAFGTDLVARALLS